MAEGFVSESAAASGTGHCPAVDAEIFGGGRAVVRLENERGQPVQHLNHYDELPVPWENSSFYRVFVSMGRARLNYTTILHDKPLKSNR